jgi:hypothetical protein
MSPTSRSAAAHSARPADQAHRPIAIGSVDRDAALDPAPDPRSARGSRLMLLEVVLL